MKAAIYTRYGPPDVVQIAEVDMPVPKDRQMLVRVVASTVNRTDCGFRSAEYFIVRFFSCLFPFPLAWSFLLIADQFT